MKQKINTFFSLLREKRKIVISNPSTFQEGFVMNMSRVGYFILFSIIILLIATITYFTIAYTSIKQYIPGYPDIENADKIYETDLANISDLSLIKKQNQDRLLWIENLKNILTDNDSILMKDVEDLKEKDSNNYKNIIFERNQADSLLRIKVAAEEAKYEQNNLRGVLYKQNFSPPVDGKLKKLKSEFVYVTDSNETVSASMKGVLVSKTYNSFMLQHADNLLSVYKNCSGIKETIGTEIPRGKAVGEVKDTALVFEVWYKGKPIDLKKIIE